MALRPDLDSLPNEDISEEEKADLQFMREEEKLAHDVYITLYERWGIQIFSNIAQSELTHTEAVRDLLVKYGITDPVTTNVVGDFTNPDLKNLYLELTEAGKASLTEALRVGALIEDLDIKDLDEAMARTDNADIKLVYQNLKRGSENHIRAFTKQLERNGVTYTPTYISRDVYQEIINSGTNSGGGQGRGRS